MFSWFWGNFDAWSSSSQLRSVGNLSVLYWELFSMQTTGSLSVRHPNALGQYVHYSSFSNLTKKTVCDVNILPTSFCNLALSLETAQCFVIVINMYY